MACDLSYSLYIHSRPQRKALVVGRYFMGLSVQAIIEHNLTVGQILSLPDRLNLLTHPLLIRDWEWCRKSDVSEQFLTYCWTRPDEFFLTNPWSEEDLPILENQFCLLDFYAPRLFSFSTYSLNAFRFEMYKEARNSFLNALDIIIKTVEAKDSVLVLEGDEFSEFTTVAEIRTAGREYHSPSQGD